jgi:hypothetical protein
MKTRHVAVGVAVVMLALCASACAVTLSANWWAPAVGWHNVTSLCVGYTSQGRFQIGFNWILPWMSSMPPVVFDHEFCTMIPWPPFFPPKGAVTWP